MRHTTPDAAPTQRAAPAHTIRMGGPQWLALIAGLAVTAATIAILTGDALTTGRWSQDQWLSLVILFVTIAFGHLARDARWVSALLFWALFAAGTALVVYTSVGRQHGTKAQTHASANDQNGRIADLKGQKTRAEADVAALRADARRFAGVRSTSEVRADMDRAKVPASVWKATTQCTDTELMKGPRNGEACKPILDLRVEMAEAIQKDDLGRRIAQAEGRVSALAARVADLGGTVVVASKAQPFAEVAGLFGADRNHVEHAATLIEPLVYTLFLELAAIVCFGFAFGNRCPAATAKADETRATVAATVAATTSATTSPTLATVATATTTVAPATVALATVAGNDDEPLPPKGGNRLAGNRVATKAAAEADVIRLVARGERLPSQGVLASRWGVHKGTCCKWLQDFEARGLISRTVEGRCKRVASAQ
jgi:hypothetical protein